MITGTNGAETKTRGFFKNGVNVTTANRGPSNFDMDQTTTRLHIGRRAPYFTDETNAYGSFDVVEMIMTEHNDGTGGGFDLDMRQKIEGYFSWKWNLVSLLPSNHPYKTAQPEP